MEPQLKKQKPGASPDLESIEVFVKNVFQDVQRYGDRALFELTEKFDSVKLDSIRFETGGELCNDLDDKFDKVILRTIERIRSFHQQTALRSFKVKAGNSTSIEYRTIGLPSVGCYVPGGNSPLISTLMMLVVPAQLADVKTICVVTPPQKNGCPSAEIQRICQILGIESIYLLGGAQAIAALAIGTETVPKVEKIVGPGNSYVTQAKLLATQRPWNRAIDSVAGPSELVAVVQSEISLNWAIQELLTQVEHGSESWSRAIVTKESFRRDINRQLTDYVQKQKATAELVSRINIDVCPELETVVKKIKDLAPEHLCIDDARTFNWSEVFSYAGAVYTGTGTSVVMGDYGIGPNHTLPTSGWAARTSGLSMRDFQKTLSIVSNSGNESDLWQDIEYLANLEKMNWHSAAAEFQKIQRAQQGQYGKT
jgi:histidinol dehydrogenase